MIVRKQNKLISTWYNITSSSRKKTYSLYISRGLEKIFDRLNTLKNYDRRNLGKIMIIVIRAGCVLKGYMRTNFKAENFIRAENTCFSER